MTLIVASAQHGTQFVVADRRVTRQSSGILVDDWTYKILQYWNAQQGYQFLVAYTGLAELSGRSTLDWFMQSLPEVFDSTTEIAHAIAAFPDECEKELAHIRTLPPKNKGLTIVLCGRYNRYGPDMRTPEYIPFVAVISNCIDQFGRQTSQVSHKLRAHSARLVRPKAHITLCRGDLVSASKHTREFSQACRLIRRPVSYKAKVLIAADYIRRVADTSKTVGKNLLGAALLEPWHSEAFDFPENTAVVTKTMPHLIFANGTQFTDFKVEPISGEEAEHT